MTKRKIVMTFTATVPFDDVIDDETLTEEYDGNIHECTKYLYKEDGIWWNEDMVLERTILDSMKTEIINN